MKEPTYEELMDCVNQLGIGEVFTPKALEILVEYTGAGDDVIFPLIIVLGNDAFTSKAKELMNI